MASEALKAGQLKCLSVYAFDLDNRLLRIHDLDLYCPRSLTTLAGRFSLKQVSRRIVQLHSHCLRRVDRDVDNIDKAFQFSTKFPMSQAAVSWNGEGRFDIELPRPIQVAPPSALMLELHYDSELVGQGDSLLFCGAVQPSDYEAASSHLAIDRVTKTVRIAVFSRTKTFSVAVFDGSKPIHFFNPPAVRLQPNLFRQDLELEIDDWKRAKYFGLCVQTATSEPPKLQNIDAFLSALGPVMGEPSLF